MKIYNPLPRWTKKVGVLCPQTKKLLTLIHLHPNVLFSGDYILALMGLSGAAPSNFYTRYRLAKAC